MLSIIICSISPERLRTLEENIAQTIGVEYEFIAIDNRERHWPIAKAYNEGAKQARYPYLFFVHEDVKFHSSGWGSFVEQKLAEPDCGVIGFAGSKVMLNCYSGWFQNWEWVCSYLYQRDDGLARFDVTKAYLEHPFGAVVAVDGLAMFVRKDVWQQYPFDEKALTGFHCYDIDFSLQIVAGGRYKNYICCSNQVLIEHFSKGAFNEQWFADTIRLFDDKWSKILPLSVEYTFTDEKKIRHEERLSYAFLKLIMKSKSDLKGKVLREFWKRPLSWRHFRHCVSATFKYWVHR